jgi:hypothetical protein
MSVPSVTPALEAIGADWLTDVLRGAGHSEVTVERVGIEALGVRGVSTDLARLRIFYKGASAGPPTLIAKIRGATALQRRMDQAMGLFAREAASRGSSPGWRAGRALVAGR